MSRETPRGFVGRELVSNPAHADKRWGYIVAYDSDIAGASSPLDLTATAFSVGGR